MRNYGDSTTSVRVSGSFGGQPLNLGTRRVGARDFQSFQTRIRVTRPRLWSPASPSLYQARFTVRAKHGVMIAAGSYLPAAPQLFAIREYLLEHHERMRTVLSAVERTGLAEPLEGNRLIRSPKGFDPEHPAADLLRNRQWAVIANLPGDAALGADFTALLIDRFRAMAPLVNELNIPLAGVTPLQREATAGRR